MSHQRDEHPRPCRDGECLASLDYWGHRFYNGMGTMQMW